LFQRQTTSLARPKQTNQAIINSYRLAAQNTQDYNQFMQDYFAANKTLNGAQEYWNQYIKDNPVVLENPETKEMVANESRMSYRNYFRRQNLRMKAQQAPGV
jgi:hypothetical protein